MRARVIATFGRQSLIDDAAHIRQATRRGRRGDVVVGDCVLASVTSAEQARIESIEPRSTLLFRTDKYRTKELAANVDQVIIVFAARPAFNRWFIWKALVAATAAGIEALVLRNKIGSGGVRRCEFIFAASIAVGLAHAGAIGQGRERSIARIVAARSRGAQKFDGRAVGHGQVDTSQPADSRCSGPARSSTQNA